MTNTERAAEVIEDLTSEPHLYPDGGLPAAAAAALADATPPLLMPDLPKPDHNGRWWTKRGQSHRYVRTGSIYSDNDRVVVSDGEGSRHTSMCLTTEEAIDLAYALLAAADHTERNQE